MASLRAISNETELGVVGEGSPLFGSAMGTFVFVSDIFAHQAREYLGRMRNMSAARMIASWCCYAPGAFVRPQLSKELRDPAPKERWSRVRTRRESQARDQKEIRCLPTPEQKCLKVGESEVELWRSYSSCRAGKGRTPLNLQ